MKLISVIFFVAAATANPIHEVQVAGDGISSNSEDWQLVPDSNGHLHLVDITAVDTDMEPQFNARNDMNFRLFTRLNPTISRTVRRANNGYLSGSNFNGNNPSRYHIHGWQGGGVFTGSGIRRAWLDRISCNVFTVDWGAGASTINYLTARNRVPAVATIVAEFVDWVHTRTNTPFSAVSVIGHSLGGHIAGLTGKRVRRGRLQSVVAMDPAGPLFSMRSPTGRVHYTDANYVKVIYTDQGNLGFDDPLGHANFYPNWGSRQPGCGLDVGGLCSHNIVEDFFEASINPANIFVARQCRSFSDIRLRTCITSGPSRRLGGEPAMDGISAPETVFSWKQIHAVHLLKDPFKRSQIAEELHYISRINLFTTLFDLFSIDTDLRSSPFAYTWGMSDGRVFLLRAYFGPEDILGILGYFEVAEAEENGPVQKLLFYLFHCC